MWLVLALWQPLCPMTPEMSFANRVIEKRGFMQNHDEAQQRAFPLSLSPLTNDIHCYILSYKLLWIDIARVASVPALTVWSMDHGLYIRKDHADRVRQAL